MAFCPVCRSEFPDDWKRCPKDEAVLLSAAAVGKYRIETMIGSGGMGSVYRATNPDTGGSVAIKLLNPQASGQADTRERFRREAAAVSNLRTRHVVRVYDFGADGDTLFLVMEFLDGHPLTTEIAAGQVPDSRVHLIIDGALRGLSSAHKAGVTHRDLKPDNIFVANTEDGEVSKILDFGIARTDNTNLTHSGAIMGTPSYMAPEQVAGDKGNIGPWTDCYAIGVILYEIFAGEVPFHGDTITSILSRIITREFTPLAEKRPDLAPEMIAIVNKALAEGPAERFQSAGDMRQAWAEAVSKLPSYSEPPATFVGPSSERPETREGLENSGTQEAGKQPQGKKQHTPEALDRTGLALDQTEAPTGQSQPPPASQSTADMRTGQAERSKTPMMIGGAVFTAVVAGIVAFVVVRGGKKEEAVDAGPPPADARVVVVDASVPKVVDAAPAEMTAAEKVPKGMVAFDGGEFTMGNNKFAGDDADPEHSVRVKPFYLDKLEWSQKGGLPLVEVDVATASKKCASLGKRLPSEAEWEFAATRHPLKSSEARLGADKPAKVGTHKGDCTPDGMCDLLGNVSEWTSDPWRDRGKDKPDTSVRAIRGGSYRLSKSEAFYTSPHSRVRAAPTTKDAEVGFRCAKDRKK